MRSFVIHALGVSLLAWSVVSSANDGESRAWLSLREAIAAALKSNPDLSAFAFQLKAQDARLKQADLGPPLELGFDLEDLPVTGRDRDLGSVQATLSLSQVIELGGKRAARIGVGQAGLHNFQIEQQAKQLDALAEVVRRYIHVAADQQQLLLTEKATQLARETVEATQRRTEAAKAPAVELRRAHISLARTELDQEHAEHELLSSRRKLAAMWGEIEPRFDVVTADLYQLPEVEDFGALNARLKQSPDYLRLISETRLKEAETRLAQSRAATDLRWTAGVRRLADSGDAAVVLGLSIPLFSGARSESAIAEAQALRERSIADATSHEIRVQTQLFELYQELQHAITETATLRDKVLPEMELALEDTRYAFERGRYGYLEWVEAQRERISVQRALIEAAANVHRYQAEIERLTGMSIITLRTADHRHAAKQ